MMFTLSLYIRLMRFFGGGEITQPVRFAVYGDAGAPFVLEKYDAYKAGFIPAVRAADILRVSRWIYHAKVAQAVVMFIAVYVVNKTVRPFTMRKQPSKPMRFVNLSAVADSDIFRGKITRGVARLNCFGNPFAPRQKPGFWAVAKSGAEMFCGHSANTYLKIIRGQ